MSQLTNQQLLDKIFERLARLEANQANQAETAEAIAKMADLRAQEWTREGLRLAAGQHNPFPAFAKTIRAKWPQP